MVFFMGQVARRMAGNIYTMREKLTLHGGINPLSWTVGYLNGLCLGGH